MTLPPLWPNQEQAISAVKEADANGENAICVTAPTGGGKSRTMSELAQWGNDRSWQVGLFTNRRIITDQASRSLASVGVGHGIISAGYDERLLRLTQVCSFQTLASRVLNRETVELPKFRLALIDEAHSNKGDIAQEFIARLKANGCLVVGFTATPANIGHLYKRLIVAGTKAELRRRGNLVACRVFAPDEPDLKGVKKTKVGEYEEKGQIKRLMETLVFANVFEQWKKLNANSGPTIQWAPGVAESRWFVEEWKKFGVSARHIDGETPDAERQQVFAESKSGDVEVICSQGVLREGVDLPWLEHGILTQPCNNLSTYLQIVGRLLRAYPGKTQATLQDHAGAYHRHGSPNEDRDWKLEDTDDSIRSERKKDFQQGGVPEPIRCPKCGGIRKAGPACPHCGHKHTMSTRMVRMTDGTLHAVRGNVHKKKKEVDPDERAWVGILCACARGREPKTLAQAASWYRRKHGKPVPLGSRLVPAADSLDWNRLITEMFPWTKPKPKGVAYATGKGE